jgi:hypothetical protein
MLITETECGEISEGATCEIQPHITVGAVLQDLIRHPWHSLILKWNWKCALFSSLIRANIFFFVTLRAGWRAALGAFLAELGFRAVTSGFYGALTQSFSGTEPAWAGALTVMILLPLSSHSLEFVVHSLRHTPHLAANIMTSVGFTVISSLFNWHAMRKGSLVVGLKSQSIGKDMQSIPRLMVSFLLAGPRALFSGIATLWVMFRLHALENSSSD